jgi:hypothetical protein
MLPLNSLMKLEGLYVYAITNFIVYFSHYSGDQDSVIPLTGSRTLVRKLAKQLALNT